MSTGQLVLLLCVAEALGLAGFATFPALMPTFIAEWGLSNTQAGTLSGAYFAGYMASVTLLVALTDRRDARWIYLGGVAVSALAGFGFALVADGFWSALAFQAAAGVGVAGTYMPGLKILSDRVSGPQQSRWVSFYTATFSIGAAGSFFMAGEIGAAFGWQWAFAAAGLGAALSGVIVLVMVPAGERPATPPDTHLVDLRPVLRCRPAMAYILGYAGHVWELFALRGWIVAFLAWVAAQESADRPWLSATAAAALINLIGLFASIGGNEMAMRFGRRRVLVAVMAVSALAAVGIGAAAGLSYGMVVALCMLYSVPVMADSAALTAGAVEAAPAGYRGATLAVHSTLGFGCGFLGSLAVGIVLDAAGGASAGGWLAAFAVIGAGAAAGAAAVAIMGRKQPEPEPEGA